MGALIAVCRIAAKRQQRGADIVPGSDRRLCIAVVVAEQVTPHRYLIGFCQFEQMPGQVEIVWPTRILHGDGNCVFAGFLALGRRRDVDADELADILGISRVTLYNYLSAVQQAETDPQNTGPR